MILPVKRNPHNQFTVVRVHYSSDPDKNTPQWLAEAQKGMLDAQGNPTKGWLREYEIDYTSYAGKPFYPEFREYNIGEVKYRERETLYRGWDYGFHRPCCVITKIDEFDQWQWLKIILGKDEGIKKFGQRVSAYCRTEYPGAKYIDADDVAGTQVSDKSEQTSREILNSIGIYPRGRKQEIREGAEIIRQKLAIRVDGKPGLVVNQTETDAIDGFKGGIHYPEAKEGQSEKEFYEKDGYYDHIFDAGRYIAVDTFTIIGQADMPNQIARDGSLEHQWRDGRPEEAPNRLEMDQTGISDFF